VGVADGSLQAKLTAQVGWLGLRVGGCLALNLHSLNELSELSQWPCHDDSSINTDIRINAIIIIVIVSYITRPIY